MLVDNFIHLKITKSDLHSLPTFARAHSRIECPGAFWSESCRILFQLKVFAPSPGTNSLTKRRASRWGGRSSGSRTTPGTSPTVLQVTQKKQNSGPKIHPHITWWMRLISNLSPCLEVPMEQPEWFVFLPGFLDKNNDLLFRNLKEVSVERGGFQSRMRSWV